ncbi:MAG: RNA polymerase sigma-70 factor [Cytophagaceae bacterium]|nr:RNA polymerase sigma-70 factor [Cytophagaceae bacterium]
MIASYEKNSDEQLLELVRNDDERAFDVLYHRYFARLYNYAYEKMHDQALAQDAVQELFVTLWLNRHQLAVTSVRAYLFSATKYIIINQLRKDLVRERHTSLWERQTTAHANVTEQEVGVNELKNQYQTGVAALPEKCRQVFMLSRSGKTNKEVSQELHISEKTVEQHISKALRLLRNHLREHLNAIVFIAVFNYFLIGH